MNKSPKEQSRALQLNSLDYVLWVASFTGQVLLLVTLFYRRLARKLPIFTVLVAFLVFQTMVLYLVNRFYGLPVYFKAFWILQCVEVLLDLAVVAEATFKVFRPLGALVPEAIPPMRAIVALSVIVACVVAMLAAAPNTSTLGVWVSRGDLFSYALLAELYAGFLYLSQTLRFGLPREVSNVVLGLGMYSVVSLLATGLQNVFGMSDGWRTYRLLSWAQIFAYLGSLTYWIVAFHQRPEPVNVMSEELKAQLERLSVGWAEVLKRLEAIPSK